MDLGVDSATGKRRQASKQGFRTKREAELALQAIMRSHLEGGVPQRSQRTVGAFLDEWPVLQRDRLRRSTIRLSSGNSTFTSCPGPPG
ncbi:MAG: Arm DNA-binding domain-containing protein [Actinomycetota bacterium]|nr:Arm DNA-binding domain-containing protein [Actinomycetota bacterium]